ncbi:hypothetical protein NDU88_007391 [Pleurodeles waltl]|uniref:Uncharacterized protein n=1 Tax=Pleurodeles waltl TaxID=8319 RepID=A0AAV7PTX3_PLEWA|nr:hypothetical protein NDU88_007391 [Pleurodeles waltl]
MGAQWGGLGVGPANVLSQSFQGARHVQPGSVGRALDGAQMVRRKAQERPPSLTAGEEGTCVNMVSVAVEANKDVGKGVAHLVKGVYVADAGTALLAIAARELLLWTVELRRLFPYCTLCWYKLFFTWTIEAVSSAREETETFAISFTGCKFFS